MNSPIECKITSSKIEILSTLFVLTKILVYTCRFLQLYLHTSYSVVNKGIDNHFFPLDLPSNNHRYLKYKICYRHIFFPSEKWPYKMQMYCIFLWWEILKHSQNAGLHQQYEPVSSNSKYGRVLCKKTFSVRKFWISAGFRIFPDFFRPKPVQFHIDSGNLNFIKICWELTEEIAKIAIICIHRRTHRYWRFIL